MDGVSARTKRNWLVRWWIVQGIVAYFALPLIVILSVDGNLHEYDNAITDDEYPLWILGTLAVVSFLQWLYLHPIREPSTSKRPVNLFWSMSVGGFVVALFLTGLVAGVCGLMSDVAGVNAIDGGVVAWFLLGIFVLTWIAATPLLASFSRRSASPEAGLTRIATTLFAGTVVEVIAGIPLDVLARRKEDCVCARGTFWTILLGLTGGLVLFGPYVFLVLFSRRRRRWPGGHCAACGADVGEDLRVMRCPGCGAGWAG